MSSSTIVLENSRKFREGDVVELQFADDTGGNVRLRLLRRLGDGRWEVRSVDSLADRFFVFARRLRVWLGL